MADTATVTDTTNSAAPTSGGVTATPPAATGVAPSATPSPVAAGSAAQPEWYSSFKNEEVKSYVTAKGFKDPEVLADSYRNLEKLFSTPKDQLLKLPTEQNSPEWNQVFEKLGKPASAADYKIEPVKDQPGSAEFTQWAKDTFYKANLTADQAKALYENWNGYAKNISDSQAAAQQAKIQAETEGLKTEWGNAYEQNLNIMRAGAKQFGVDAAKFDKLAATLGVGETFKLFQSIGSKLGEASFTEGLSGGAGRSTPEVAKAQIAQHISDPAFAKAYANGGAKEKALMNKLYQDAYPGETQI